MPESSKTPRNKKEHLIRVWHFCPDRLGAKPGAIYNLGVRMFILRAWGSTPLAAIKNHVQGKDLWDEAQGIMVPWHSVVAVDYWKPTVEEETDG